MGVYVVFFWTSVVAFLAQVTAAANLGRTRDRPEILQAELRPVSPNCSDDGQLLFSSIVAGYVCSNSELDVIFF